MVEALPVLDGMILSASKEKCYKVLVSFGIWYAIIKSLNLKDRSRLQKLNKWFYNHAVGRV